MFRCPKCKAYTDLPVCRVCGFKIPCEDNIWRLTDMPDIVTEGDGDKYIGYEYIGESYSGSRKYIIDERFALFAKEISGLTGDGIFLDLGCGDGCITVPCASFGTKIIAGDISRAMLSILQERAGRNNISLENVTLCRMNALDIPLKGESVDVVVANSVLHLISNPGKVVSEIHRVLKKGGCFVCQDDKPGKAAQSPFDNEKYNEIANSMYNNYWNILKEHGVFPVKYSWRFDREALCDGLFSGKATRLIEQGNYYEVSIRDGFLSRFAARGFSDQVNVPKDLHDEVIMKLMNKYSEKYGGDFADVTTYRGTEDDLLITIYTK